MAGANKSSAGSTANTFLELVGLKKFGNRSKYEPLVDTVELLEATPTYAHVKFKDGHEDTVALRHLAPCPGSSVVEPESEGMQASFGDDATSDADPEDETRDSPDRLLLRRSSRLRRPVDRYVPA